MRFWDPGSWRAWREGRRVSGTDPALGARLEDEIHAITQEIGDLETDIVEATLAADWARQLAPRDLPIVLADGETGLGTIGGVTLGDATVPATTDEGVIHLTDQRMIFVGAAERQWALSAIAVEDTADGLRLTVAGERHILTGPTRQLDASIEAASGWKPGQDPGLLWQAREDARRQALAAAQRRLAAAENRRGEQALATAERTPSPMWVMLGAVVLVVTLAFGVGSFLGGDDLAGTCGRPGTVDVNHADFDQLQLIIHIGPDRAGQIIDMRPFESVSDMVRILGIADARLADIRAQGISCAR